MPVAATEMQYTVYFLIALVATTAGSLTGMGGGVIIKPAVDLLGEFDVQTIGALSSLTVFSMSAVSISKHLLARTAIPFETAIPLALGAAAGGLMGDALLHLAVEALRVNEQVTIIQNAALTGLIAAVFVYMQNKAWLGSFHLRRASASVLAGLLLGICSSFLGIGGGPINVAVISLLFSYDTKTAAVCSLITILFAQISKLGSVAVSGGFSTFDLRMAPVMILGAIAGGFIGAELNRRCREDVVEKLFSAVQLLVLGIAVLNIVRNLVN